jgi:anti-sigma factor RsiW
MRNGNDMSEPAAHLEAEELSRLADGFSLPEDRTRHLADCRTCADELAAWQALSREAGNLAVIPMPPGLETQLLARLRDNDEADLPAWLAWWGRPWGLATAALLLLAATIGAPRWLAPEPSLPVEWAWAAGLPAAQSPAGPESGDDIVLDPLGGPEHEMSAPVKSGR